MKDAPTYIYVLTNPCLVKVPTKQVEQTGLVEPVKIGRARDVPKRLGTLNTSMTENFVDRLVVKLESERDAIVLENVVQEVLDGLRIYTSDGSSTEFFACSYQFAISEVKRLAKKLHFHLTEFKRMGYIGRSSSAIKKNHKARQISSIRRSAQFEQWSNITQLCRIIARRGGNEGAYGGILQYFNKAKTRRACVSASKWRKPLEDIGVTFDDNGYVVDWSKVPNAI